MVHEQSRRIDAQKDPATWRHWTLSVDGRIATLKMDVAEDGGLGPYELKLNSYDLAVDLELADAVQRLRFEHPEVAAVVLTSGKDRVFCAGANIRMLSGASHHHKVNFCKFTNETRNAIEEATALSGQTWICAVNGVCAGGGYELALACDAIVMADDGATAVSLPEAPLLAVLPGTGGLTRLVDKRRVRRDRADYFCTLEEGVRGARAVAWRLVEEVAPRSRLDEAVRRLAQQAVARSDRPAAAEGVVLTPLRRDIGDDRLEYETLSVALDRAGRVARFTVRGPAAQPPADGEAARILGVEFWPLKLARELDDAMLQLRFNELELGVWSFRTEGEADRVADYDALLAREAGHWFLRETTLALRRAFKRLDLSSRSIFAFVEPGSCFVGTLLELALAADRSYMLAGAREGDNRPPAMLRLTAMNFGPYLMSNGLSRLATRFLDDGPGVEALRARAGEALEAAEAEALGLVTFAPDDIDWEDEVRLAVEQRAAFSPDALTGLEANLRFAGPETMETKIFARLTAWQNWIFQRPNATGEAGALKRYGTGERPDYDMRRA
jgi:benzoyl-CoA-dihydrodiol lyase